ncbi:MAG: glycosyltransferase family 2 protein [Nitrospiraceae bacterium]|nr:glycosyltransferase family 2 protein [Nitrospiraceae bacterium]
MKLVSVIIVNWNGKHLLDECLQAVLEQTYRDIEILLVDNGSRDGSAEYVRSRYPAISVVALPDNRGFTGGNIAGYDRAKGAYIVLLNNDASLCRDWIERMVETLESDAAVGFCASKILIAGTALVDSAGDCFTTAFNGTKIGEYEHESKHTSRCYRPGACAAAVIYRRTMLDDIGFLDDDFYFNHEDTDLNLRAWLSGWKCAFVPEAVALHKVSASVGKLSDKSVYYFSRNIEWVWLKNTPLWLLLLYLPQRMLYETVSFGMFCIMQRKWRPFVRGKIDAFRMIVPMLRKRRRVQSLVRLSAAQIRAGLMPLSSYIVKRLAHLPGK